MKTMTPDNPLRNCLQRLFTTLLAPASIAILASTSVHSAILGTPGATQVEYTLGESGADFSTNFTDTSGNNRNMTGGTASGTSWNGAGLASGSTNSLMIVDGRAKYNMDNATGVSPDYQVTIFLQSSNTWGGDPNPTGVQTIFTMDGISFKRQGLNYYGQVNGASVGTLTTTEWAGTGLMFQKVNDVFSFWTSNDGGISWTQQGSDVTAAGFGANWGSTHLFIKPGGGETYTGYADAFAVRSATAPPQANILAFGPGATIGPVTANAAAISWTVATGSNPATLAPTFTLSDGATCEVSGLPAASGSTQDFTTNPVHYIVKASDYLTSGTFTDYSVTVSYTTPITWGPAITIAGDSDVSTTGTLAYAYHWNTGDQTVNGVTFTGTTSQTAGGSDVDLAGFAAHHPAFTGSTTPFTSLSAAYQAMLAGSPWSSSGNGTVTLKNLIPGHSYAAQVWLEDPRSNGNGVSATLTSPGGNSVVLDYNSTEVDGGVGQYSIGTFTVDATTKTFTMASGGIVLLNALQVRDLSVVAASFSTWANDNGATGQTPDQDHDNDGVANGIEYFMGQTGSSFTALPGLDGSNTVTWTMDPAYNGTYEVQTSPDLSAWTNVAPKPVPSGGNLSYTLPTGLGKQFVRLFVTPTP
ncbi:MAG: hypothetical protein NTW21_24430 [Verrucomicrobia bacterium]|nr:hypothetical protein [Verrucomicrobiota bacterium]